MLLDLQEYLDHRENLAYLDFKVSSTIFLVSFILHYKKIKIYIKTVNLTKTLKKVILVNVVEEPVIIMQFHVFTKKNLLWR